MVLQGLQVTTASDMVKTKLIRMYVITGHHCCLWCEITYEQLQVVLAVRGASPARSLQTLDRDLHKFQTEGISR